MSAPSPQEDTEIMIALPFETGKGAQYRHGADRAILRLSRDKCGNAEQRQGYDDMATYVAAWQSAMVETANDQVDAWAADLQSRWHVADQRRTAAIVLAGQPLTTIAAGSLFDVTVYSKVEIYS